MPKWIGIYLCPWREPAICNLVITARKALKLAPFIDEGRPHPQVTTISPRLRLEIMMASPRKEIKGGRAYAGPLLGVLFLVACYLVLSDWQYLPTMIDTAIASVHWPV